jgi:hypothetical protein
MAEIFVLLITAILPILAADLVISRGGAAGDPPRASQPPRPLTPSC